jgi:precorrin-2 dehydrogenase/sirohydrochlorin ferrochelatase
MSCVVVIYRGIVRVAISTGGKSPLFAKRFGERLEASIAHEHGKLADVLSAMRVVVRYHGESSEGWQAMFEHLIEASCLPLPADVATAAS